MSAIATKPKTAESVGSKIKSPLAAFSKIEKVLHRDFPEMDLREVYDDQGSIGIYSVDEDRVMIPCEAQTVDIIQPVLLVNKKRMLWVVVKKDNSEIVYSTSGGRTRVITTIPPNIKVENYLSHNVMLLRYMKGHTDGSCSYAVRFVGKTSHKDVPITRPGLGDKETYRIEIRPGGKGFSLLFWGKIPNSDYFAGSTHPRYLHRLVHIVLIETGSSALEHIVVHKPLKPD